MAPSTTRSRSLLDITDDMQALDDLLVELGGDVTEEQAEQAIDAWLAELDADLNGKVDRYCALIQSKTLTAALRKAEAERLLKRSKAEADGAEFLKHKLHMVMLVRGIKKAGQVRTASVCGNGGKLPLVVDPNTKPEDVPPSLTSVTLSLSGVEFSFIVDILTNYGKAGDQYEVACAALERAHLALDNDAIRTALEAGEELPFARFADRGTHLRVK